MWHECSNTFCNTTELKQNKSRLKRPNYSYKHCVLSGVWIHTGASVSLYLDTDVYQG